MKLRLVSAVGISLAAVTLSARSQVVLKDQKDKVSYSIGVNIGASFKNQGIDVNAETLLAGIKDALAGSKTVLNEDEIKETLKTYQRELVTKQAERARELGEKNKKEGDTFLAENKKKPGVKTTASGLQYKILKEGKGQKPKANDTVRVHYKGTLVDGSEFDSSYKGEPAEFSVSGVIPGWTEAVQLMPVGSKWQLFIPSDLAYGDQGQGPVIGPNATLVFEVELLAVVDQGKDDK
jgi:FKBP-type peptidyl-prolyl cis-trans isomerase FklB